MTAPLSAYCAPVLSGAGVPPTVQGRTDKPMAALEMRNLKAKEMCPGSQGCYVVRLGFRSKI